MISLLVRWFRKNQRPLPWRQTRDPYCIWISETMLQQTQVSTVIPYYDRWMKKFPNLRALARAPLSRVLKAWEGLGYYSRARNLYRTSRIVLRKYRGKLPDSSEELMKLPGIGRYSAGAIASIAFGKKEPVLDGNVKRVLSRVFALKEAVDTSNGEKKLWEISRTLVGAGLPRPVTRARSLRPPPGLRPEWVGDYGPIGPEGPRPYHRTPFFNPGEFNQALMELGALVCLPENPQCSICPLGNICRAHRLGKETEFPLKARRQRLEKLNTVAVVIWKNGRVLLERQPLRARWGGLWMFPQWIHRNGKGETEFLKAKARQEFGTYLQAVKPRMEIEHGFTKYRVRLRVYEGKAVGTYCNTSLQRWCHPKDLTHLPLPSPHQKIAESIQDHA